MMPSSPSSNKPPSCPPDSSRLPPELPNDSSHLLCKQMAGGKHCNLPIIIGDELGEWTRQLSLAGYHNILVLSQLGGSLTLSLMMTSRSTRHFFLKRRSIKNVFLRRRSMRYQKRKKKIHENHPEDRLTSLPKNAIEAILLGLPLKDAARTSVLSRDWRYEWTHLPQLVFDDNFFRLPENQPHFMFGWKLAKIINQVLIRHQGPIHKFKLSTGFVSAMDFDGWIGFVSRNGIREFILDNWLDEMYKIPSCLFSCKELVYLELSGHIEIPHASFTGLISIRTLVLDDVHFSDNGLENFISSCPFLNVLKLRDVVGCPRLKLCAPNLVDLTFESALTDISFDNTPLLAKASIMLRFDLFREVDWHTRNLPNILGCLPAIKRLELLEDTYQVLSGWDAPVRLQTVCQLLHLSIGINFERVEDLSVALCIFRSSPYLQMVDIKSLWDKCEKDESVDFSYRNAESLASAENIWDAQEESNDVFSRLRFLSVTDIIGTKAELKFIEFVLANAPVLEVLHVALEWRRGIADAVKISTTLVQFKRLSSEAAIWFETRNGWQSQTVQLGNVSYAN